jgi:phosphatidylserine/phosphatidylglycerophosphate/cardiolipin synthase-like enzyme
VQAYALSAQPIVKALLDAQVRGVAVRVILDKSEVTEGLSPSVLLSNAGASVYMDGKHGLAHSHVMVIDRGTVLTGSYSFTKAAEEQNAEDLIVIRSQPLAELYRENWERHRSHSSR